MAGGREGFHLARLLERAKADGIAYITVRGVIENDGKILLLKRADHYSITDMFELPGGRRWEREGIGGALRREIHEETGLEVSRITSILVSDDYVSRNGEPTRHIGFTVDVKPRDAIRLSPKEHNGYLWASLHEASELPVAPRSLKVISAFAEILRTA